MSKALIDSFSYLKKIGSHSTSMNRRGHLQFLPARAMPELQEINSIKEQLIILRSERDKVLLETNKLKKVLTGDCPNRHWVFMEWKNLRKKSWRINRKIKRLMMFKSELYQLSRLELFGYVAMRILPIELTEKINNEVNILLIGMEDDGIVTSPAPSPPPAIPCDGSLRRL